MPDLSELSCREIQQMARERDLQSEAVKDCAESVKADNPDMEKSTAFAICQAQENRGELSDLNFSKDLDEDDPCWEDYVMVGTKIDEAGNEVPNCVPEEDADPANLADDCPDGHVKVNGECMPLESADTPPGLLSEPQIHQLADVDTEPIEREELSDEQVAYRNLAILQAGVWTDSASREEVWYSPKGLSNLEVAADNAVNIMHDADNSVSEAGEIDPDSLTLEGDTLFADVIVDTSNAAGQYADQNLQKTLETQGAKGFGGPSVEIAAEGQEIEFNEQKGMRELVSGVVDGLAFVKNPASKPVSFARQTAERGVALAADSQEVMRLKSEQRDMADVEDIRETLEEHGVDTESMNDEELMGMAETLHDELMSEMQNAEHEDDEDMPDEDMQTPEEDEDEEEEMGTHMEEVTNRVDSIEERLANVEDMVESAMAAEDVEEALSDTKEELADADTVAELAEAKENLEKRLSDLEDQPQKPKSLADADGDGETPENVRPTGTYDKRRSTYRR